MTQRDCHLCTILQVLAHLRQEGFLVLHNRSLRAGYSLVQLGEGLGPFRSQLLLSARRPQLLGSEPLSHRQQGWPMQCSSSQLAHTPS